MTPTCPRSSIQTHPASRHTSIQKLQTKPHTHPAGRIQNLQARRVPSVIIRGNILHPSLREQTHAYSFHPLLPLHLSSVKGSTLWAPPNCALYPLLPWQDALPVSPSISPYRIRTKRLFYSPCCTRMLSPPVLHCNPQRWTVRDRLGKPYLDPPIQIDLFSSAVK